MLAICQVQAIKLTMRTLLLAKVTCMFGMERLGLMQVKLLDRKVLRAHKALQDLQGLREMMALRLQVQQAQRVLQARQARLQGQQALQVQIAP